MSAVSLKVSPIEKGFYTTESRQKLKQERTAEISKLFGEKPDPRNKKTNTDGRSFIILFGHHPSSNDSSFKRNSFSFFSAIRKVCKDKALLDADQLDALLSLLKVDGEGSFQQILRVLEQALIEAQIKGNDDAIGYLEGRIKGIKVQMAPPAPSKEEEDQIEAPNLAAVANNQPIPQSSSWLSLGTVVKVALLAAAWWFQPELPGISLLNSFQAAPALPWASRMLPGIDYFEQERGLRP